MSILNLQTSESAPRTVSILAGVIRKTKDRWELLSDPGHSPIGLISVIENTNNSIQVNFDKKYNRVLTCSITPDETYARKGYVFGGSCGLDKVIIYHSKAGVPSSNSELAIAGSNIWIQIMMFD